MPTETPPTTTAALRARRERLAEHNVHGPDTAGERDRTIKALFVLASDALASHDALERNAFAMSADLTVAQQEQDAVRARADAAERTLGEVREMLRRLYAYTGIIDNGHCVLCRAHRKWKRPGMPQPCEFGACLSHRIDAALTPEAPPR